MTMRAQGSFEVTLTPQHEERGEDGVTLGRLALHKTFEGDLVGSGQGSMLSARTAVDGSAGYVAIERVSVTLAGRSGSFVLQHNGTMSRGDKQLSIGIVPDSGSGGLAGIAGIFTLRIEQGRHLYTLDYTLPG